MTSIPDHKIIQIRSQDHSDQTTRLFKLDHKIIQTRPQNHSNQFKPINQELSIQPAYIVKSLKTRNQIIRITNQIIKNQTKSLKIINQCIALTYKCPSQTYHLISRSHGSFNTFLGHWAIYKAIGKARKCASRAIKDSQSHRFKPL